MTLENERRFLVKGPVPDGMETRMVQAYFSNKRWVCLGNAFAIGDLDSTGFHIFHILTPDQKMALDSISGFESVRLRLRAGVWTLTIKGPKTGGVGVEIEEWVDGALAQKVFALADEGLIDKTRREINLGSLVAEVDFFHGFHEGLVLAEVENPPKNWTPPPWFGAEITDDIFYANATMAKKAVNGSMELY